METLRRSINTILALAFVAAGCGITAWLVGTKAAPPMHTPFTRVTDVAVTPVEASLIQMPVVGYGTVRPKNQVNIVPQVSGKLIHAHADLAQGMIIAFGELLFEIEPTVYEARVRQVTAEIQGLEASLQRHDQDLASLSERIAIAEQMLAIEKNDHLTVKRLYEDEGVGTARDVDHLYRQFLHQSDVLVELRSRQAAAPYVSSETQARLDAARARLTQAEHNLESTKILCPFRARVESVGAYKSQVVTAPLSIATLTDMEAFEIAVGIDPRDLRWLDPAVRPAALHETDTVEGPEVTVRWSLAGQGFTWRGFVSRLERVDEATRAARMVVEVREADMVGTLAAGSSNTNPMLSIGMHCRADLPAQPLPDAMLIPRHAVHDHGWVYVFEPDADSPDAKIGRLGRRRVPMLRSLGEFVLVDYAGREGMDRCDLRPGEQLVISPVVRPVVGMKVRMRDDQLAAMPDFLVSPPNSLGDRLAWISGPLLACDAFSPVSIER